MRSCWRGGAEAPALARESPLEAEYGPGGRRTVPAYGEVELLLCERSGRRLMRLERRVKEKAQALEQLALYEKLRELRHPSILRFEDFSCRRESALCANSYVFSEYFELPPDSLRLRFIESQRRKQPMSHRELTHVLYQASAALEFLHQQGCFHGQLSPLAVTFAPAQQLAKLLLPLDGLGNPALTRELNAARLRGGQLVYASPAVREGLRRPKPAGKYDRAKEDVFALGLVLLECGVGAAALEAFSAAGPFDPELLRAQLDCFAQRYGRQNTLLVSAVRGLLTLDEALRPNFRQVNEQLPRYEQVKAALESAFDDTWEDCTRSELQYSQVSHRVSERPRARPPNVEFQNSVQSLATLSNYKASEEGRAEPPAAEAQARPPKSAPALPRGEKRVQRSGEKRLSGAEAARKAFSVLRPIAEDVQQTFTGEKSESGESAQGRSGLSRTSANLLPAEPPRSLLGGTSRSSLRAEGACSAAMRTSRSSVSEAVERRRRSTAKEERFSSARTFEQQPGQAALAAKTPEGRRTAQFSAVTEFLPTDRGP